MIEPNELGQNVHLIELFDLGMEQRTGSYVLLEDQITIIETSASPSIAYLMKGLEYLNITLAEIKYIIVTHIHLDHAGGVGLFLEKCPNAKVIVHPRGKRHLADPARLIAGAQAVYGDQFDRLFNPIFPVPEDRLLTKEDGGTLQISDHRTLTFYDTPGHAKHHFSIYDSRSNGIFTGDTIGVYYPHSKPYGFEFVLPSTSPNQFNPNTMLKSVDLIEKLNVDQIYFGHYGKSEHPAFIFEQIRYWLPRFVEVGEEVMEANPAVSLEEKTVLITERLYEMVRAFLNDKGIDNSDDIYNHIQVDMPICAMGIIDYLNK